MANSWPLVDDDGSVDLPRPLSITPTKHKELINAVVRARSYLEYEIEQSWHGLRSPIQKLPDTRTPSISDARTLSPVYDSRCSSSLSGLKTHYNAVGFANSTVHSDVSTVVNSPTSSVFSTRKEETPAETPAEIAAPVVMQIPGPPQIEMSKRHEALFIAVVCSAQLLSLAALAQTVAPVLIIGKDLAVTNPGQLPWFTAAFSMSLGTFILPAGRLGDIYGHKKLFLFGWLWFAAWSAITGFSYRQGPILLSICRGFQGIGPALLVPNAMAMIGRTFPIGMKRNLVFSIFGACGPIGWVVGATMSALISQLTYWAYQFWALAIACGIIGTVAHFVLPSVLAVRPGPPGSPRPKFDWYGAVFGVSGLILINFALNQAPLVGWSTPYIYFILIIGLVLFAFFIILELHVADSPLLPLRGLQPQAAFTLACIAFGWASHGIWIWYINLFLMNLRHHSPLLAQAELCGVAITGTAFALSTGYLLKRIHVSTLMFLAMTVFCGGTALIAFAPVGQNFWLQTFFSVVIMPAGMNWSFPAGTMLLSNAMPKEMQGKAASLVSTVVNYSIATGLGLAGTIESSINHDGTKTLEGYRGAWYLGMGLSGMGMLVAAAFMLQSRMEKKNNEKAPA